MHFRSYQILLSDDITPESRLMFDRQIRARVAKIAPFLIFDEDPYPVIHDGRIFWIQDAYTASARYPYSTPAADGINYIRNSVKIVIDAYDGTVTSILPSRPTRSCRRCRGYFRRCCVRCRRCRQDLLRHVRYPEGIFNLQASMYSTLHMTNPGVFYNKEDQWEVPAIDRGARRSDSHGALLHDHATCRENRRPSSSRCCRSRRGVATTSRRGWWRAATARSYGQLLVFQFPKQKLVFGPSQVVARINQDQVISPQITLWNQQGSQVIQGTLMVIPIEESLIYVRPLYLRAQNGRIPELHARHRRVSKPDRDGADARGRDRRGSSDRPVSRPAPPVTAVATGGDRSQDSAAGRGPSRRRRARAADRCRAACGRSAGDVRPRDRGAEGRRLGEIRRGNQKARRNPRADERSIDGAGGAGLLCRERESRVHFRVTGDERCNVIGPPTVHV